MNKHYMVISIGELKRLLAVAQRGQESAKHPSDAHCICLDLESNPDIVSEDGRTQIASGPFWRFLCELEKGV